MSLLHGFYLIVTLGSTYYVLYRYLSKKWKPSSEEGKSYKRLVWANRKVKLVAFLIILVAWWFQNEYRHNFSPEAIAMKKFDELLDKWRAGEKIKVINELDFLSDSVRPWEPVDDPYEDY